MEYIYYFIFLALGFALGSNYKKILFNLSKKLVGKIKEDKDETNNTKDDDDLDVEIPDFDDADLKMVFLVRDDLKLGAGKIAAQVAHAAVGLVEKITEKGTTYYKKALEHWNEYGAKKIVLRAKDLEELKKVQKLCKKRKIPCTMISDAGHTQVDPGTVTVLGVGVEDSEILNKITGEYKLMR